MSQMNRRSYQAPRPAPARKGSALALLTWAAALAAVALGVITLLR